MGQRMDIADCRNTERERARIADLMDLLPQRVANALDIGARDGFIAKLLAERADSVTALDLEQPDFDHPRVRCMKGDVTALDFPPAAFELTFCAEVLEHIPGDGLIRACQELVRVSSRFILIGVPYEQDIRLGRCTCQACGGKNPPWGHVNSFDERRLRALFPACDVVKTSLVGTGEHGTNDLSTWLMDLAGNPYGTYEQDEPCIHCGSALALPPPRNLFKKALTRSALLLTLAQRLFQARHASWIHVLFEKRPL